MSTESVSIIVATFNRAHYLVQCLDSLLAQTHPACEIVLVDDGSEDDTPAVAARYGPRIHYVRQPNAGKASAVNRALAVCRGEWVWLFDDDDVALPDAIEKRLAAASQAPQAGAIYSPHWLGSDASDGSVVRDRLYTPAQPPADAFFLEIMANCFFHLNSCLVRRTLYERIGGFDAQLLRGQDYDAQIRLARVAEFAFCPHPSFVFRQHAGARGPKSIRADAAQRASIFKRFSVGLGTKIRRDVSLAEFAVPPRRDMLDPQAERVALGNRLLVMANHGCVPALIEDLAQMLETRPSPTLQSGEAELLARAIGRGWAYAAVAEDWPGFLAALRAVRQRPAGPQALRALARGLYLQARGYPDPWPDRLAKLVRAAGLAIHSMA